MDALTRAAHAARVGDRSALERLVEASYPDVWRLCAALVDREAADDLAQETIVRAMRALGDFRGHATARTWILAIARRTCMDELRARSRRRRRDERLSVETEQSSATPDSTGDVAMSELVSHLDPERRAAFLLTQLFRLSYDEAAVVCGCPPGTIRSRVARARAVLIDLVSRSEAVPEPGLRVRSEEAMRPAWNRPSRG